MIPAGHSQYFDLEDPVVTQLMENPMTALQGLRGVVVIDEAQRQSGLFPVLGVLADREHQPATFLILGSASPELSRQASESLAGRVEIIELRGFDLNELPSGAQETLWQRGGFPRSYLAAEDESSVVWRKNFIRTSLERDLAALLTHPKLGASWEGFASKKSSRHSRRTRSGFTPCIAAPNWTC